MHHIYIKRCFDLAKISKNITSPNPNVGALLVYVGKIIGEGFTSAYGGPHAEVNCINSVAKEDCHKIPFSTLYVSLEPCFHFGKTPPCVDLIICNKIKNVIISCSDPFELVDDKSIAKLRENDIHVVIHVLKNEGEAIIKNFRTRILKKRPFITLKMAESKDHFIGQTEKQVWLTNPISRILSHKFRGSSDAILIGTNTAIIDNPRLNTRFFVGKNPLRIVLDRTLKIPITNHIMADEYPTIVINELKHELQHNKHFVKINFDDMLIQNIISHLNTLNINHLTVEGGAKTIQSFLDAKLWDEAHLYQTNIVLNEGIRTPKIEGRVEEVFKIMDNTLTLISNTC